MIAFGVQYSKHNNAIVFQPVKEFVWKPVGD